MGWRDGRIRVCVDLSRQWDWTFYAGLDGSVGVEWSGVEG